MAIHTFLYRAFLLVAALALVAGCTDPKSNPIESPPPLWEGDELNLDADDIVPSSSGKPWIVNSDWSIEAGRTVTIHPGTTIMFSGVYNINVDGKIVAEGQADQPNNITFTSAFLDVDLGQWGNIRLKNPTDPSVFKYCVFSYGAHFSDDTSSETSKYYRGMLSIRNSSPVIENCLAIYNQDNAIYIHADSGLTPAPAIQYNVFTQNDGAALRTNVNVDMSSVTFRYNCVGDNNVIPFLLAQADSTYGRHWILNANLDSVDLHYNLLDEDPPELADPANGDYTLTSCSPAVDAGPDGVNDGDGTRRDLGPAPYHQVANELRGVWSGTLNAGIYRMSCDVRVPVGSTLTIPAGTRIEATGLYNLEVFGRLEILGTRENRVVLCNCQVPGADIWGGIWFYNADIGGEASVVHNADILNYQHVVVWTPGTEFDSVRFAGGHDFGVFVGTNNNMEMSDAVTFRNCEVNDCGIWGIVGYQSPIIVQNSLIQNIKGRGIWLWNLGTRAEITNTVVRACSTSAIVLEDGASPQIVNCVLTGNDYHGLHLINNSNPLVMNTIIWANHHKGVYAVASSNPQMEYNNISGNLESDFDPPSLGCANCIAGDPLFVSSDDVHLQSSPQSPCINAGNPDPQYNDVDGSRNDQGAYGGPAGGSVGTAVHGPNRMVVQR